MAIGFSIRAQAKRKRRSATMPVNGLLDFSSPTAGALVALLSEDF